MALALITGRYWKEHRGYAWATLITSLVCVCLYLWARFASLQLPTGSHPVCFAFGVFGAAIILFEALLWLRKKLRTWRIFGSPYQWMKLHLWAGILVVPLAFLHSGFFWGGPLTISLMIVLLAVVLSGIAGLVLQQVIPGWMLGRLQFETIHSQIDRITCFLRRDAEKLIRSVSPDFEFHSMPGNVLDEEQLQNEEQGEEFVVVGVHRKQGDAMSSFRSVSVPASMRIRVAEEDPITVFAREQLDDFLSIQNYQKSPLATRDQASLRFDRLRKQSDPELSQLLTNLERICDERRDLIRQRRMHRLLHGWLLIHYPLTLVLLALLGVHIIQGLKYW